LFQNWCFTCSCVPEDCKIDLVPWKIYVFILDT
jgi:hypothetical protein